MERVAEAQPEVEERVQEVLAVLRQPGALTPAVRRALAELLAEAPGERRMSYEEFLAWADEDTWAEWVEGRVVMMTPASQKHQQIVFFLAQVLNVYVQTHELGIVLVAPFQMKLEGRGREPDVLFVKKEHVGRLKGTYLEGPADLVVEVMSAESVGRDRGEKYQEYQAAGVGEYWLVDPEAEWAEFYQLGAEGHYRLVQEGGQGRYESRDVPGFWLEIEWLWDPPQVLEVLRALKLV